MQGATQPAAPPHLEATPPHNTTQLLNYPAHSIKQHLLISRVSLVRSLVLHLKLKRHPPTRNPNRNWSSPELSSVRRHNSQDKQEQMANPASHY